MAGRRLGTGLALAALLLSTAGCSIGGNSATKTVTRTVTRTVTTTRTVTQSSGSSACTGDQLSGTFSVVQGSQGAGQISYTLSLSTSVGCVLSIEKVVLLEASDTPLPTKTFGALPSGDLAPGVAVEATARFSPDVPGKGDSQNGDCQPKAFGMQITPSGGGVVTVPVKPPTSVCARGSLVFPSN